MEEGILGGRHSLCREPELKFRDIPASYIPLEQKVCEKGWCQ